jgi:ankyrin repeat protein
MHLVAVRSQPGAAQIVPMLKKAGGDLDVEGDDEWSPLALAIWSRSSEAVRALADAGADLHESESTSALMFAVKAGDASVVRALLEKGADPKATDESGRTALGWALHAADPTERMQWSRGSKSIYSGSPQEIVATIERADPEGMIAALLKAGADPNAGDGQWSPLALAAYLWNDAGGGGSRDDDDDSDTSSRPSSAQRLLLKGFCASHDPTKVVRMLLDAGAVRRVGGENIDPLDVAARRGDARAAGLVEILRKLKVEQVGDEKLTRGRKRSKRAAPKEDEGD